MRTVVAVEPPRYFSLLRSVSIARRHHFGFPVGEDMERDSSSWIIPIILYTRCGDYYIPDLKLSEQPEAPIGKYGRMRQRYLKEHRPGLYSSLILSEKLYPHLLEIDRTARERMDAMLPRMMEAAGVTEELKARDPMRWVGLMDTLKVQVEEIIQDELIYN